MVGGAGCAGFRVARMCMGQGWGRGMCRGQGRG